MEKRRLGGAKSFIGTAEDASVPMTLSIRCRAAGSTRAGPAGGP